MLQMRACRLVDTDASAYLMRLDAGDTMTDSEHRDAWKKTRDSVRQVLRSYGHEFFEETGGPSHTPPTAGPSQPEQYQEQGAYGIPCVLTMSLLGLPCS